MQPPAFTNYPLPNILPKYLPQPKDKIQITAFVVLALSALAMTLCYKLPVELLGGKIGLITIFSTSLSTGIGSGVIAIRRQKNWDFLPYFITKHF